MVEVPKNFTPLTEEKQALSPSLCSKVPSLCQPAELDRSDYSETRLMAASKRSIIKTQNRSFSGGTRTSPTGFLQLSEGGVTPTSSVRSTVDDIKRLRPDSNGIRHCGSQPTSIVFFGGSTSGNDFAQTGALYILSVLFLQTSLLSKPRLQKLLSMELAYHPNNAFLYYVDPVVEDKVDATLRNEAVHGLRCIHNAFFTLSAETFCKAVNIIDRFVVKVKVCARRSISCFIFNRKMFRGERAREVAPSLPLISVDSIEERETQGGFQPQYDRLYIYGKDVIPYFRHRY
ncbi:unnamed protein product [Schistocephalus solidus]|uniref:Ras-related and estrogen-regulated growth inhibitor n=1 Tax=Schistocephalus solidus TaxID=70667 RepID=A0A183TKQ0_SCHSO|nr:unnamed protein product [Schistocephalus solidus]